MPYSNEFYLTTDKQEKEFDARLEKLVKIYEAPLRRLVDK